MREKMKKLCRLVTLMAVISLFAGIGMAKGGKTVKITLLNSKGEIQASLEKAVKAFMKENPNVTMEILPNGAGQSPFEKISSLYAAGTAPALLMLDTSDVLTFKAKILDLSKEKWVKEASTSTLDLVTTGGKVFGFPFTVEGCGFIYNQAVLDKAYDGKFDPAAIKTTIDLENAFKKVAASGVDPIIIAPLDWSLGAHFMGLAYTTQTKNRVELGKFVRNLKNGKVNLVNNKVFNGILNTFDVMKKYNKEKADPLAVTYEKGPEFLGKGEVGFWFMGNWAWPQIQSFDKFKGEYGFIPVPISNNAADYGNTEITAGVTKYLCLDKTQNSKEQQAAAKKFLQWLVYSKSGQEITVNDAKIIPAFKNNTLESADPLSKSIRQYMGKGKTIPFMTLTPPDHWAQVGAAVQKYLAGKSERAALLKEIAAYWKRKK